MAPVKRSVSQGLQFYQLQHVELQIQRPTRRRLEKHAVDILQTLSNAGPKAGTSKSRSPA